MLKYVVNPNNSQTKEPQSKSRSKGQTHFTSSKPLYAKQAHKDDNWDDNKLICKIFY